MTLGAGRASLGTQSVRTFNAVLVRPHAGDELDLALEMPPDATPEELNVSIFALMQGVLWMMDDAGVLLMDRAFRYLKSYWDEGAEYGDLAAARNMANRALRDAGADAAWPLASSRKPSAATLVGLGGPCRTVRQKPYNVGRSGPCQTVHRWPALPSVLPGNEQRCTTQRRTIHAAP
jgi:hypothetical protein